MLRAIGIILSGSLAVVNAQRESSWPQDYPGKPKGDLSPEWQSYKCAPTNNHALPTEFYASLADYQVTEPLPNVTFELGRSWAGNIPVGRGSANNTLFFWGFEKENGSLTANAGERSGEPWGVWLNGG
jgi:carboxypeptidase D